MSKSILLHHLFDLLETTKRRETFNFPIRAACWVSINICLQLSVYTEYNEQSMFYECNLQPKLPQIEWQA